MLADLKKPLSRLNHSSSSHAPHRRSAVQSIEPSIAVLVIACNRVDYVKQTLDELLKYVTVFSKGTILYFDPANL